MEHHKLLVFRVSPGERVLRIGHGRVWVPRCGPGDRALGQSPELCWIQTRPSQQEPTVQTPVDPSIGLAALAPPASHSASHPTAGLGHGGCPKARG